MSELDRRQALGLGGAALFSPAAMMAGDRSTMPAPTGAPQDPLSQPLLNYSRAYAEMERTGVDALICRMPQNIYYLTNYYPLLSRMGMTGLAFAVFTRNQAVRPQLVIGEFIYYYSASDDAISRFADVHLYTGAADSDAAGFMEQVAFPTTLPQMHTSTPMQAKEVKRRQAVDAVKAAVSASAEQSLVRLLRDLKLDDNAVIAVDDSATMKVLSDGDIAADFRDGENLIRSIRLQKSEPELAIQRYAARANAEAGLYAAKLARDGAMVSEIRAAYAAECLKRGLAMEFMIIDRVSSPVFDQELKDGQAFLIDCVGQYLHYHGDYGRTIFVGEPTKEMRIATNSMANVWNTIRETLRPGMLYSDVNAIGAAAIAKENIDANIMCNPHSVGMFHTDEPTTSSYDAYVKDDLRLVEGMVLSVDVPMIDTGMGGSAHLEDLTLITVDGSEPLNDIGNQVILV